MRNLDFGSISKQVKAQAAAQAERIIATAPDHEIQADIRRPRQLIRDRGIPFNRVVREGNHYGFFQDEEAVAVVIKNKTQYDIHFDKVED